ncbi:MAG: alpha-amylase [Actinomycetota bacterium]
MRELGEVLLNKRIFQLIIATVLLAIPASITNIMVDAGKNYQDGLKVTGTQPMVVRSSHPKNRTVFVHLFEWKWTDIAQECENFLGPKGYAGVQVSPPSEHRVLKDFSWEQRYQPVSYKLQSRSGSRAEFAEMVSRCKAAGVDIYVDAIINHTTGVLEPGQVEKGSAGSTFGYFDYPAFKIGDFHHCGRNSNDALQNWYDRWEVQNCRLLNLADLKTESTSVRRKIASYLNDLMGLGVAGFRIDSAKHIPVTDLEAIFKQVQGNPFIYQEVIASPGEPIQPEEYLPIGSLTEFRYSWQIARSFRSGKLADLQDIGKSQTMIPSDKAVIFTNNHDNQRDQSGTIKTITFKDSKLHKLANIFMLAWPYGYPQIMSSYAFKDKAQGPPSQANGETKTIYINGKANCFQEWICEHRLPFIANMVGFRNYTQSQNATASNWWSNGSNQIAFSVANKGFVAINSSETTLHRQFQTGLPAGTYCNAIAGELISDRSRCTGNAITVDANGLAEMQVPPMDAVALYGGQKM